VAQQIRVLLAALVRRVTAQAETAVALELLVLRTLVEE
jgi:hypothetical protein